MESGGTQKSQPRVNTFGSGWLPNYDLFTPSLPYLLWGRIVDLCPSMNAYRVQVEHGTIYTCTLGSLGGSHTPTGVRQITTLALWTPVYFIFHPQNHHGTIVCIDPQFNTDPRQHRKDWINHASRSGLYIEPAHEAMISRVILRGGMPDFSAERPVDSTQGEWGYMSETGLGVYLDPFLAFLRVDEETGLHLYYHDQLARLAGHNMQIRTSLHEDEYWDDQVEGSKVRGLTPYTWEANGAFEYGTTVHKEKDPKHNLTNVPEYALIEPIYDDQQPFYRMLDFEGYLGQSHKDMTCLPPQCDSTAVNRYKPKTIFPGVSNIQTALTGAHGIESAKRIYITKRLLIPTPKLIQRPESELGDKPKVYKHAGLLGQGEDHKIKDELDLGTSLGPPELVRASAILDLGAFTFNWESIHPFHYHHLDWYVPEECDICPFFTNMALIDFCHLQDNQFLDAPDPIEAKVDHRYPRAKYYPNESFQVFLEDGGIVIGDGFGAEIKMTGGSIFMSAPGDIFMQPGKNFNVWAGWDAILKAYNSADITANRKDVRLKAEHNVQVLGGNDGCGGVLIESRGICAAYDFTECGEDAAFTGVIIKAQDSPVIVTATDVLVEATPHATHGMGEIILDAYDRIKQFGTVLETFATKSIENFFVSGGTRASDAPDVDCANEYWCSGALISSPLMLDGQLIATDGITCHGWITTIGGHFSSDEAHVYNNFVTDLGEEGDIISQQAISSVTDREDYLVDTLGPAERTNDYDDLLRFGAENATYSLRTTGQYRTSDFLIFENRWQQLARLGEGDPTYWIENTVDCNGSPLLPHPGIEMWKDEEAFYRQNLTLYSIQAGASIDRTGNSSLYENPAYGDTIQKKLDGNYPIIRQC